MVSYEVVTMPPALHLSWCGAFFLLIVLVFPYDGFHVDYELKAVMILFCVYLCFSE